MIVRSVLILFLALFAVNGVSSVSLEGMTEEPCVSVGHSGSAHCMDNHDMTNMDCCVVDCQCVKAMSIAQLSQETQRLNPHFEPVTVALPILPYPSLPDKPPRA